MRHLLELLPGAEMPDIEAESAHPGARVQPPDDDDLLRPLAEDALLAIDGRGSLVGRQPGALAKHLVRTFGPVHAALPFPLALRVELDGDRLVTVDPEIGFLHQGIEKAAEGVPLGQLFAVVARASPLAPLPLQLATAQALEELLGVTAQVPLRAQLWRVVALELSRLAEHLRMLANPSLAPNARQHRRALTEAARVAGGLLDAIVAGNTFAAVGGMSRPLDGDEAARVLVALPGIASSARNAREEIEERPMLDEHLEGLGRLSAEQAIGHGVSGPALRACGVRDDVRMHSASPLWRTLGFEPRTAAGGCARARMRVRLAEVETSCTMVARGLEQAVDAPHAFLSDAPALVPATVPPGLATGTVEAHHGEVAVTLVSDGSDRARRVRLRLPSAPLVASLGKALPGDRIMDVVTVMHSFGMVGTEVDR